MHQKAFTLVELIIVISIIALLSTVGVVSYNRAQNQAHIARAQGDLKEIATDLVLLANHTGQLPQHYPADSCINNFEINLNLPAAGLISTDGNFPNWQGPYSESDLIDPWGIPYRFDPDYKCYDGVKGCEEIPDGKTVRAIFSYGPDMDTTSAGSYNADNIVRVQCDP